MSFPLLTDEQIASACISYRHDFGLLEDGDRHRLMFTAREWERAMSHEIRAPLLAALEEANAAIALVRQQRAELEGRAVFAENDASAMRALVERLIAELADLRQQLQDAQRQHDVTRGDLERTWLVRDEMAAELADAREDAERYRWLCKNYAFGDGYDFIDRALNDGDGYLEISAAIDDARRKTANG